MPYTANNDWRTSKNNIAPDAHWSGPDDTLADHRRIKAEIERAFPDAVVVGTSTRTYNCHAFAHASSHAWFDDPTLFMRDDYYQYTPGVLRLNDVVVYFKNGLHTHSAVIIKLSAQNVIEQVRSKWGPSALVEHPPGSVPADYGSITYYLRKLPALDAEGRKMEIEPVGDDREQLVAAMLDPEKLRGLWIASTPDVAEAIVKGWREFSDLQIQGGLTPELFAAFAKQDSPDSALVLAVLARHSRDRRLRSRGHEFFDPPE